MVSLSYFFTNINIRILNFTDQSLEVFFEISDFIKEVCEVNQLRLICKFSALIYFHKYFLVVSQFDSKEELYLACVGCIVLAIKTSNQLRQLNDESKFNRNYLKILARKNVSVCGFNFDINFVNTESKQLNDLAFMANEKVFFYEFDVMAKIGFDLNLDLPFKYIDQMDTYLKKYLPLFDTKITQLALSLIDNFYTLPLCLNYQPLYIVLTCYNLITKNLRISFPDLPNKKKWHEIFGIKINIDIMSDIGKTIGILTNLIKARAEKNNIINQSNNEGNSNNLTQNLQQNSKNKIADDKINYTFYQKSQSKSPLENPENYFVSHNPKNSHNHINSEYFNASNCSNLTNTCSSVTCSSSGEIKNLQTQVDKVEVISQNEIKEPLNYGLKCNLIPKSTYSEKVTTDSDSNLDEQAFSY